GGTSISTTATIPVCNKNGEREKCITSNTDPDDAIIWEYKKMGKREMCAPVEEKTGFLEGK
ncbi:hypothetical protein U1Q18_049407, partial [Sarracenia purpurea var. burkii]